jgi:Tol biopolymer transport system component
MWSRDGRRIAFTSHRTGDDEIYVMSADGSHVHRVTYSRGADENPSWLPQGRLVISSERAGKLAQLYVVRISDGHAGQLTHEKLYHAYPQASPDGHWIAYTAQRREDSQGDTVVMRSDGSRSRRITHGSSDDSYAAWSPDSRRIVYSHYATLYLIDRDGRNNRRVDPMIEGYDASWGRDGTIFFDSSTYENEEIAAVGPRGGIMRLLTDAPGDADVEPNWSSDGTRLVFQSDRSGDDEIWSMNADGSGLHDLSQAPAAADGEPVWSPDTRRIAFSSDRGSAHNDSEIVVMNTDGSNQVNVSHSPANDFEPAWSPDGIRIAFARFVGNAGDIWVMNADGSNQVRLTTSAADDEEPAWSPDGSKILFKSTRDGGAQIYVMNADGSGQHVLVVSGDYDAEPSWSPDGTAIVFDRYTNAGIEIVVAGADGSNDRVVAPACVGKECNRAYAPDPSWQPMR